MIERRVEVAPRWPLRLPSGGGMDGVLRSRGGVLHRLMHLERRSVVVRVARTGGDRVLIGATAPDEAAAEHGIERMRFALGIDDDLADFHRRFGRDPLIGRLVRADPALRVRRRPQPWEALAWAVCEQLIEFVRAAAIQRRLVSRLGPRCPRSGLRDVPSAEVVGRQAPALLASMDLSPARAATLVRVAREVSSGRAGLDAEDPEPGWRRLRAVAGIGSWTVETLALRGQGRYDQLPAGDLAYRKLVGRLDSGGDPRAVASEQRVRERFEPYGRWAGLAGAYALRLAPPPLYAPSPARPGRFAGASGAAFGAECPLSAR